MCGAQAKHKTHALAVSPPSNAPFDWSTSVFQTSKAEDREALWGTFMQWFSFCRSTLAFLHKRPVVEEVRGDAEMAVRDITHTYRT